ncbi:MAG: RNA methyltransferase [Actinomycetota bacterium]|nr:RNA methyltransferase [Actinomycetota bacterium]
MAVITSTDNPAVRSARRLARRRGRVRRDEAFLVEGPQVVAEAIGHLQRLFVRSAAGGSIAEVAARASRAGTQVLQVDDAVLASLATTVATQGLVGVATLNHPDLRSVLASASTVVVLHQVRDPGNLGTILRTADAAGAGAVVLTSGSVDPRNPKAVRASAGSLFHLPVIRDVAFTTVADACAAAGLRLVAAAADGTVAHTAAELGGRVAVVFGSEAHGLGTDVRRRCDDVVAVPLSREPREGYRGHAESLNLAATVAVVTYEMARRRNGRCAGSGVEG